jgi:hypothetical protein
VQRCRCSEPETVSTILLCLWQGMQVQQKQHSCANVPRQQLSLL